MSALCSAIDELAGEDIDEVGDAALAADLEELHRQGARLQAEWLRRLAAFDRRSGGRPSGAVSTAAWLRESCRFAPATARERVAMARRVRELPHSCAALAAGDVDEGHMRVLTRGTAGVDPEIVGKGEATLVQAARKLDPVQLRKLVVHWRHAADPGQAAADSQHAYARRGLHLWTTFEGMVAIDGLLDPATGSMLSSALNDRPLPEEERTAAQRRADALGGLVRRRGGAIPRAIPAQR